MMTGNMDRAVASLGYDRIRLVAPVFIGDTVTTAYEIVATDPERQSRHRQDYGDQPARRNRRRRRSHHEGAVASPVNP